MSNIGIVDCPECNEPVPVFEKDIDLEVLSNISVVHVIVCAICYTILNKDSDVSITYYPYEQLEHVTRWRLSDELRPSEPGQIRPGE